MRILKKMFKIIYLAGGSLIVGMILSIIFVANGIANIFKPLFLGRGKYPLKNGACCMTWSCKNVNKKCPKITNSKWVRCEY